MLPCEFYHDPLILCHYDPGYLTLLFRAYYYRTLYLTAYVIGTRVAYLPGVIPFIETIYDGIPLGLITYVLMPTYAILMHKKTPKV